MAWISFNVEPFEAKKEPFLLNTFGGSWHNLNHYRLVCIIILLKHSERAYRGDGLHLDTNDVYFWSNLLVLIYEKRRSDVKLNCFWSGISKKKFVIFFRVTKDIIGTKKDEY